MGPSRAATIDPGSAPARPWACGAGGPDGSQPDRVSSAITEWRLSPARESDRTRCSRSLAPAAWARSIARATRRSTATSRSRCCPTLFASDAERLARFTREAQTLAALNHPNIAHIHGLEDIERRPGAGDGAGRGRGSVAADRARRRCRSTRRCRSRGRSPRRSKPRTSRGSSTAISSPPTSRCAPTAS